MSNMISRKLRLQSVNAFGIGYRHDGGIVDQSVDGLRISINFLACLADLLLRAEIEFEKSSGNGR